MDSLLQNLIFLLSSISTLFPSEITIPTFMPLLSSFTYILTIIQSKRIILTALLLSSLILLKVINGLSAALHLLPCQNSRLTLLTIRIITASSRGSMTSSTRTWFARYSQKLKKLFDSTPRGKLANYAVFNTKTVGWLFCTSKQGPFSTTSQITKCYFYIINSTLLFL